MPPSQLLCGEKEEDLKEEQDFIEDTIALSRA
jgi:hypothetical protein